MRDCFVQLVFLKQQVTEQLMRFGGFRILPKRLAAVGNRRGWVTRLFGDFCQVKIGAQKFGELRHHLATQLRRFGVVLIGNQLRDLRVGIVEIDQILGVVPLFTLFKVEIFHDSAADIANRFQFPAIRFTHPGPALIARAELIVEHLSQKFLKILSPLR